MTIRVAVRDLTNYLDSAAASRGEGQAFIDEADKTRTRRKERLGWSEAGHEV